LTKKSKLQKAIEEQKGTQDGLNELFSTAEKLFLDTKLGEEIDFSKISTTKSYGRITPPMFELMRKMVKGKRVFDFGAHDLTLSKELLVLGAEHVVAIDKEVGKRDTSRITTFDGSFELYLTVMPVIQPEDVAFVSWPSNHPLPGLLDCLKPFSTVIYLGKNTDGSSCAWPGFFLEMLHRSLIECIPHHRNTLLVWGKNRKAIKRKPVPEELAGIDHSRMYSFIEPKK